MKVTYKAIDEALAKATEEVIRLRAELDTLQKSRCSCCGKLVPPSVYLELAEEKRKLEDCFINEVKLRLDLNALKKRVISVMDNLAMTGGSPHPCHDPYCDHGDCQLYRACEVKP
jgi:hypothetical protein